MKDLKRKFKYNQMMKELLEKHSIDYPIKNNVVKNTIPSKLQKIIEDGILIYDGCYIFKNYLMRTEHITIERLEDHTGYECFVNVVTVDGYLRKGYTMSKLLTVTLSFFDSVAELLEKIDEKFMLITSFQDDEFVTSKVRFYKIRDNEPYLADDIEEYLENGVLVLEIN